MDQTEVVTISPNWTPEERIYFNESDRVNSFIIRNWSIPFISRHDLAKCGFYYIGEGDKVY